MQYDTFTINDGTEAAAVLKKGKWTEEEDEKLRRAVIEYGVENWVAIEKYSGLARQSKSCRLRWINHLRPNLKKGPFGEDEERVIVQLHHKYGNRWSRIASKLPGRTDNEIKNFWHKRVKKCKKHHRPVYPAAFMNDDQNPTNITNNNEKHYTCNEINVDGRCWLDENDNSTPTNYPNYTIHSHLTHLPDQNEASIMHSNNFPRPFTSSLIEASYPIQASIMQQDDASSNHTQILSSTNKQFGGFQMSTSQLSPWDHFVASPTIEMPQALMHVSSLSSLQVSSSIATSTAQVPPPSMQSPNSMTSLLGHLTTSPSAPTLSHPNMEPVSLSLDLQPIQPSPSHSFHVTPLNSSFCVETEHPSIQFSSPQEYGLHKVRSDSNLEIIAARKEAQAKARYRRKTLRQIRIPNKRDFVHEIPSSSSRTEPTDIKCLNMNGPLDPTQLRSDDFVCEFASREGPASKSIEIFYSQDSFLMEDLFGQNCGTEQVPIFDSLGPLYSQSTATTLLKTEFTESVDRNFIQEQNLQENGKILELHEQNLLYHQYPNLIESGCVMTERSLESELGEGRSGSGTESSPDKILKREYSWDQSLCAERRTATREQNPLMSGLVPSVSQSSITHLLGHSTWKEESCEFTKQVT